MPSGRAFEPVGHNDDIPFTPNWDASSPYVLPALPIERPLDESIPVIIAEDDPISRTIATAAIERGGFRTIVTSDGNQAMAALRSRKGASVAVIDWMMPGMDGAEMCRRIRESGRNVHIIMLTSRGTKEDTVAGMDHGADDYMVKPFNRHELLARIRSGVRQLTTQAALQTRLEDLEIRVGDSKLLSFRLPL